MDVFTLEGHRANPYGTPDALSFLALPGFSEMHEKVSMCGNLYP
jgi:hypothetical protein